MKRLAFSLLALAPAIHAQVQLPLPAFSSTLSSTSLTRGFYFQTPVDITIVGLRVPDESSAGVQCVEVSALGAAPPAYPATASGGQVFYASNVPSSYIIPCRLDFAAGAWVGVMGACGTTTMNNSYGTGGAFATTIAGQPVTLTRFLTQTNLNTAGGQPYSAEPSGPIGRVEVYYTTPALPTTVGLPAFGNTFSSGTTRGFYFQTPVPIIIRGLRVPDESRDGTQNVEVKRMSAAPPAFSATTTGGEVFYAHNVPSYQVIPCYLPFSANDWIGVLGACGTTTMKNSYATPAGPFATTIAGLPVTLTRMGTQTNLNVAGSQPYWSEAAGTIARVELYYEIATGYASATTYGLGCNRASRGFYELSTASAFDLAGVSMTMVQSLGHYNVSAAGSYVPPPGSAISLPLGDDSESTVTLASPFSFPGGSATNLVVCSNGFVSAGASNGFSFSPNSSSWLASAAPRWGDWHDYNPGATGSGRVKFHESGNVSYVTWDGVYDFASSTPNTWQLQFNRTNGSVTFAFVAVSGLGNSHLVGYAPAGTAADDGGIDISARLPGGFSTFNSDIFPLALSASARPVIGSFINIVTDNLPAGSLFGTSMLGLVPRNVPLAAFGAPTCSQYIDPIVRNLFFGGPSVSLPFAVPSNPIFLGAHIYGQSAAYAPGQNPLNVVFSNGLDLKLDLN